MTTHIGLLREQERNFKMSQQLGSYCRLAMATDCDHQAPASRRLGLHPLPLHLSGFLTSRSQDIGGFHLLGPGTFALGAVSHQVRNLTMLERPHGEALGIWREMPSQLPHIPAPTM